MICTCEDAVEREKAMRGSVAYVTQRESRTCLLRLKLKWAGHKLLLSHLTYGPDRRLI